MALALFYFPCIHNTATVGPFKCYVTQMGVGGVTFSGKKRYEGVRYNVISVTRGWVGVQFPGKKCYVTFEWPHSRRKIEFLVYCVIFNIRDNNL